MPPKKKKTTGDGSGPSSSKDVKSYEPIAARVDLRKSKFFEPNIARCFEQFRSGVKNSEYFRRTADTCLTSQLGQFRAFAIDSYRFYRRITAIKWHPSKSNIVALGSKCGEVVLRNVNGIEDQATTSKPQYSRHQAITNFCFNPFADDSLLMSSVDGTVTHWNFDVDAAKELHDLNDGYNTWFCSVNASEETGLIVAGDSTGLLHLFGKDMNRISAYKLHKAKVNTAEFNKKQNHIFVTASLDKTVKMWDVRMLGKEKGKSKISVPLEETTHDHGINAAYFSRTNSNRLLLTDQSMMLKVYAMPFFDLETTIYHPHRQFQHLTPIKASWHPLADLIVAGRYPDPSWPNYELEQRGIDIIDAKTGQNELRLVSAEHNSIMSLNEFNCTGEYIASGMGLYVVYWKASRPQSGKTQSARGRARAGRGRQSESDDDEENDEPKPKKPTRQTKNDPKKVSRLLTPKQLVKMFTVMGKLRYCPLTSIVLHVFSLFYHFTLLIWLFLLPSSCSRQLDILTSTLVRDIKAMILIGKLTARSYRHKMFNSTAYSEFEKLVDEHPKKICFEFDGQSWTFRMMNELSGKVANAFEDMGYRKGDVIAILATNSPEYVGLWLGLSRLGVIASLINVNVRGHSLKHCITACNCKAIIFSTQFSPAIYEIKKTLDSRIRFFQLSGQPTDGFSSLESVLALASPRFIPNVKIKHHDPLVYVYTSGTTGLPKAAIIAHARFLLMASFSEVFLGVKQEDKIYIPLPLYHVAGGLLSISMCTVLGATGIIEPKFSSKNCMFHCSGHKCTVAVFIGEMCRYILMVPPSAQDTSHKLRLVVTTGIRSSVWKKFVERFKIETIREIYGATEANIQFVNLDNKIGTIGFIPRCLPKCLRRNIGCLVRVDPKTQEVIRGKGGFCVECETDEVGMLLGLIPENSVTNKFYGYVNKNDSEKKILRNVFQKGDEAFLTGDLMSMDKYGYLYFKDRAGDTFRWKGENVSSFEVETVIGNIIGSEGCVVYGVKVGDTEGKAGMVALVDPNGAIDLDILLTTMEKDLPKTAIPLFIRLIPELPLTGTFRYKKIELANEGFNPNVIKDPLYFKQGLKYIELTDLVYEDIVNDRMII
ncbi:fatty acid transport protein [Nesidiocoris tenuis]|uniref:Long-chain-fatty-acid--CoA ligase n=1 Tax=Nesidiocoris tenuis TaxID=355587 RepID=A0ABN7AE67_9HEMI|nr:fatty acid transport protein [Nesidiocoris tenuis]